jgi:glutamate racemase
MKIGICDYGIGGIGLYKILREKTSADIVYFSDTGYTPYGKVPMQELKERFNKVTEYLLTIGVDKIAVACNAASTVIPENSKGITGIIEHGINLVTEIKPEKIAITGGTRTIESELYKKAFEKHGISVTQRIAQELSIRIEAGDLESDGLKEVIKDIFTPIKDYKYILLACTHYPAISNSILAFTKNSTLLDPVNNMADWILQNWSNLEGNSSTQWLTSGDPEKMRNAAKLAYKINLGAIDTVTI